MSQTCEIHEDMKKLLFVVLLLASAAAAALAQGGPAFRTEELKRVAARLRLDGMDTLKVGYSTLHKDSMTVVVRKLGNGCIDHIGMLLFNGEMRQHGNAAVMDFLESALLCNTFGLTENKLKYVDVKFLKGGWRQMLSLSPTATFTLGMIDGKAYEAVWREGTDEVVSLLMPIKYDMMMNAPRKELEHNFVRDLRAFCPLPRTDVCRIDTARLKAVLENGDTLYMLPGKQYMLPTVTDATYYRRTDSTGYVPVVDARYPVQTVANMVLTDSRMVPEATVSLTVVASDGSNDTVAVPLRNLVEFAKKQGCTPYFSYEETRNGTLHGALFFYNMESGYDHVLSLSCAVGDIGTDKLAFVSRAYLFAPTTNVKSVYEGAVKPAGRQPSPRKPHRPTAR